MTVMITGGAGFVGLNIAESLLAVGDDVVLFGLEAPSEAFIDSTASLPGNLHSVIGDVRDRNALTETMSTHAVRRLVHGAAITAGPDREATSGADIVAVNVTGTINVLEAALKHGVERVVQLSSGSVYGPSSDPANSLDEVTNHPVPESVYGITKYASERLGVRYRQTRGLDVVVARLGVVFGKWEYATGMRDALSVPRTCCP
ncbi:NAD-dependent epimerase/dehydratase family protein [Rhodococcus sp. NPDC057529]|uniref:NAD-dependent epimerase/dehydratase family protein n=1 Tax=Rhodococcus sp. NPDC057529 TaxID=3346158 RepID=UPI003671B10F